jgi:MFS family permease
MLPTTLRVRDRSSRNARIQALIRVILLLGSGFSALVYQVLWLRLLGLVFGVTVHAASTVLAAFMAGLAIGSVVAGRLSDRSVVPLKWFGIAEILIGVTALSTPWLLGGLDALYQQVHASVVSYSGLLTAVRFLGSLAVLLVPTTLMGATMPLVLRSVVQTNEFGTRAAALYAANTAGALMGALVTLIARTFLEVFPHTTVWADGTLLAGTLQPLRLSEARYRERLADSVHADALAAAGLGRYDDLLRLYTAGAEELRAFVGEGPALTDDRPVVEFFRSLPENERDISVAGLRGDVTRLRVP